MKLGSHHRGHSRLHDNVQRLARMFAQRRDLADSERLRRDVLGNHDFVLTGFDPERR
jgi:hypothetical protein